GVRRKNQRSRAAPPACLFQPLSPAQSISAHAASLGCRRSQQGIEPRMTFRSYGASFYLSTLALSTSTATKSIFLRQPATRTYRHGRLALLGIATHAGAGGGNRTHGLGIMR